MDIWSTSPSLSQSIFCLACTSYRLPPRDVNGIACAIAWNPRAKFIWHVTYTSSMPRVGVMSQNRGTRRQQPLLSFSPFQTEASTSYPASPNPWLYTSMSESRSRLPAKLGSQSFHNAAMCSLIASTKSVLHAVTDAGTLIISDKVDEYV